MRTDALDRDGGIYFLGLMSTIFPRTMSPRLRRVGE